MQQFVKYALQTVLSLAVSLSVTTTTRAQTTMTRALLVDDLKQIITNDAEYQTFAALITKHKFTELALYTGGPLDIRVLAGKEAELSRFIGRARGELGIKTIIAATGSNAETDRILNYQNGALNKLDGFWIEYEFWNNVPRDFNASLDVMNYVKLKAPTMSIGTYLGRPTATEALEINKRASRVFLHSYVPDGTRTENYLHQRLVDFAALVKPVNAWPIFSAEPNFMGPWLGRNGLQSAENEYMKRFNADAVSKGTGLTIGGFYYYSYHFLKQVTFL